MNKSVNISILLALMFSSNSFTVTASPVTFSQLDSSFQAQIEKFPFPDDFTGKPSRFAYLRKLLEISSGAKKVISSDNLDSHNAYLEARKTYVLAAEEPDNSKVNILLDQTVKQMYKAIRLASPKQLLDRKKEHDYKRKLSSVNALLEALERIAIEKNVNETAQLKVNIIEIITEADGLLKKHHVDKARIMLDKAYLLTKTSIKNMRNGDVLIRELHFESIEEEYAYELDRNDTHQMLIKLLIQKKLAIKPDSYKKKVNERVARAVVIRSEAEKLVNDGNHKGAISELEKSTKELVLAIRMGGVFIPS